MQKRMNRKGIVNQFLSIVALAILVGIFALVFNSLGTGLTGNAQTVMQRGENLSLNVSAHFGTVGTVLGVTLILGAVTLIFGFFRTQFGSGV